LKEPNALGRLRKLSGSAFDPNIASPSFVDYLLDNDDDDGDDDDEKKRGGSYSFDELALEKGDTLRLRL